jgi:predicted ATPase
MPPTPAGRLVERIAAPASFVRSGLPDGGGRDQRGDHGAGEGRRSETTVGDANHDATRVDHDIGALKLNVLLARLDKLPPAERQVIGLASVFGDDFSAEAVAAIASADVATRCVMLLEALVRTGLIAPVRSARDGGNFLRVRYLVIRGAADGAQPSLAGEKPVALHRLATAAAGSFRFRHPLIRDAAYNLLSRSQRAMLHEQLASWLEESSADRLADVEEMVGYHLQQAYRHGAWSGQSTGPVGSLAERAATHLSAAGHRALTRRDFRTAARLLEAARDLVPVGSAAQSRISRDLARARAQGGGLEDSRAILGDD